jgi:hypothetical protein
MNGYKFFVRFEVFTAMTMKNAVYWDVAPCSSCVNRRFRGTYPLRLQGRKIRERGTSVSRWLQEAIRSSETSVHTRTTQRHIPENGNLRLQILFELTLFYSSLGRLLTRI